MKLNENEKLQIWCMGKDNHTTEFSSLKGENLTENRHAGLAFGKVLHKLDYKLSAKAYSILLNL